MYEFLDFPEIGIIFCYDHEATCVFIETMNDTRTIFSDLTMKSLHLTDKLIYKGSFFTFSTGSRVRVDPCIFIYHEEIFIFLYDLQWAKIRLECRRNWKDIHLYRVASLRKILSKHPIFISFVTPYLDLSHPKPFLNLCARILSLKKS